MLNPIPLPWRICLVVLAIGLVFCGGYDFGRHVAQGESAQKQLDQALAYAKEIVARQQVADSLATDLEEARAAQAPKDRIITKEVIRYAEVTPAADRVVLPGTWRLRHDAAATGDPIDPGAGPLAVGEAGPVEDAAALETVADNYQQCREWRDQLNGWQRYYREVIRHGQGDLPGGDSVPAE